MVELQTPSAADAQGYMTGEPVTVGPDAGIR
jgi:hypothetical protein